MEQTLPSSFPRSTKSSQSPNHYKALPPTPSLGNRISLSPLEVAYAFVDEDKPRRSSSIYSRAASAWYNTAQPPSLTEHPVPKINSIYRDSGLTTSATMSEPQLLLPRTYSPLIATPSTGSTDTSPARMPPFEQRPSALLPLPVVQTQLPRKHLHTVSLELAQAAQDAPGSEHLLPEELRARTVGKARSSEHIVRLADQSVEKPQKPGSAFKFDESQTLRLPSMMMLDAGTWHSYDPTLHRPSESLPKQTHVNQLPANPHWSGSTAIAMSRDASQSQSASTSTADLSLAGEPERGRTLHRLPRGVMQNQGLQIATDAGQMAAEYTSMLTSPWDDSTPEQSRSTSRTDDFAPQPLFASKQPAGLPGSMTQHYNESTTSSISPKALRPRRSTPEDSRDDDSQFGTPPPTRFFSPDSDDEQEPSHSRTGSIPISPPLLVPPLPPSPTMPSPPVASVQQVTSGTTTPRLISYKAKKQARESAYYPYVGKRRQHGKFKSPTASKKAVTTVAQPNLAIHAARTAARTTKSPAAQPTRKLGDMTELLATAKHKASKLADKLIRPADHDHAQPISPANLSQSVTAVYLGWSEESKEDFDASKPISPKLHYAAGKYNPRPTVKQTYTHTVTPARPLDERAVGSEEQSVTERPGHSRKSSIFGSLLDLSRDRGREKRREDIKKTTRVIPNTSIARPTLEARSMSVATPYSPQEAAPRMGLWSRGFSEFGMI